MRLINPLDVHGRIAAQKWRTRSGRMAKERLIKPNIKLIKPGE